jgi:hypothetical protein
VDRSALVGESGVEVSEAGVDDPGGGLGQDDGQPASLARELVAMGAGDPLDDWPKMTAARGRATRLAPRSASAEEGPPSTNEAAPS